MLKKYSIALIMISTMAISSPSYALFGHSSVKSQVKENTAEIERVDQEDHRAVSGTFDSDNGSLTINTNDMDGGMPRSFVVDGFNDKSDANKGAIDALSNRIEQVGKEDMRVKGGTLSGGTLTLNVRRSRSFWN